MLIYTVHEPPRPAAALDERADGLVFIKEGLSLGALLLGPIWLGAHRLWLALVGYVALLTVLVVALRLIPGGASAVAPVLGVVALGLGLEANTIRRWMLERRGWQMIGTVTGKSFDDCEHRFLEGWLARSGKSERSAAMVARAAVPATPRSASPAGDSPPAAPAP